MVVVFIGTRGEIDLRTPEHRMHSALLVDAGAGNVMVDCGLDWLDRVDEIAPAAIVLTHAHRDHAGGLRHGAPCPVYGTNETLKAIQRFAVHERRVVSPRAPFTLCGLMFEAFPVEHSFRAPAVAYRVAAGEARFLYAPDVASIDDRSEALARVALYIGDGASLRRPIVRWRDGHPVGHASIRDQLGWCAAEQVPRAIFTHCGSQVVRAEMAVSQVFALGREYGVDVELATDGMALALA